ncbi:IS3 family transposase [Rhodococcus erythropolis]|uniref:IS3 family transposase n=1 Tax=Rhodococcus erythropolis TaxID=1833 RepID=UPI0039819A5B
MVCPQHPPDLECCFHRLSPINTLRFGSPSDSSTPPSHRPPAVSVTASTTPSPKTGGPSLLEVLGGGSTLKIELIYCPSETFATRAEAEATLFRYIDGWYNPRRIQAGLGGLSPDEYEQFYHDRSDGQEADIIEPELTGAR